MKYPHLFSPLRIRGLELRNRIVQAPMNTHFTRDDGTLSETGFAYYLERARGGAGLIILEASALDWPYGKGGKRQPCFTRSTVHAEWSQLTEALHGLGTAVIAQINHNGFKANRRNNGNRENVTASAEHPLAERFPARGLTTDEVRDYVQKYAEVSKVIQECGFDGVEIHAAHGYLLNEFLSPLTNRREDEYGGSTENRARILTEILEAVRSRCGSHFIISVRFPACDEVPGGLTFEETARIIPLCEKAGADIFNCSVGFETRPEQSAEGEFSPEGQRLHYADAAKKAARSSLVAIAGKLRSADMCERALAEGRTDLVVLGRQLICDPYWPEKVRLDQEQTIRPCLSCSEGCVGSFVRSGSIRCAINPFVGYEHLFREHDVMPAAHPRHLLIIGGGIAGMQAAILGTARGHRVTLLESSEMLGGQMILAAVPPHKKAMEQALQWFRDECVRRHVEICTGIHADTKTILSFSPDAVIAATGSLPCMPKIPGSEWGRSVHDLLSGAVPTPEGVSVCIIGGGSVGCEAALLLTERGNSVTVLECAETLCREQEATHRAFLLDSLKAQRAVLKPSCTVTAIREHRVEFQEDNRPNHVSSDLILFAVGQRSSRPPFIQELQDLGITVRTAGDALRPSNFRFATRSAAEAVLSL